MRGSSPLAPHLLAGLVLALAGTPDSGVAQRVPPPAEILGYDLGEQFTDVAGIARYLSALAESSPLLTLDSYGWTPEGRPLLQAVIAAPQHRTRLDEILRLNEELTDPTTLPERAAEIAGANPAIVYLTYGVHGNEAASSESALWLAHDFASGAPEVAGILDSVIVVIDPVANPDGRDRYVSYFRQAAQSRPNTTPALRERREPWPGGRFNHYLLDLNRDWAWLTQLETRSRLTRFDLYSPQVHVDFHEMGYESSYFFFPAADPINALFPPHVLEWAERFGAANSRAMDREGLLYYTGENFDLFYPGYGDSWPSLRGAVGMTYEQGGGGAAGLRVERADGTVLTLRDRALEHRVTAHATLRAVAEGRRELLLGFAEFHRRVDEELEDVYLVPGEDPSRAEALVGLLLQHGIEVDRADEETRAESVPHFGFESRDLLPAGTFRVRARQPLGRLAAALLRPDHFLDADYSYDITAWALPYAYGVEAHSALRLAGGSWSPVLGGSSGIARPASPASPPPGGSYGYLLRPSFSQVPALVSFLEDGGRAIAISDAFSIDGADFPRGTLFFPRGRNDDLDFRLAVSSLAESVIPVSSGRTTTGPDLGTDESAPLFLPRVGLLGGEGTSPTGFGTHWFFLEAMLDLPFDILELGGVPTLDLTEYDVLILPAGSPTSRLGEEGISRLDTWVRGGGTLIAVAEAALAIADTLAGVRERTESEETDSIRDDRLERALMSREEREIESWRERTPGTIFQVTLDEGHPLTFGVGAARTPDRAFVLSSGVAFEPDDAFETAAFFPEGLARVSGVVSDRNLGRLERGAWLVESRRGEGKVILFADDPLFRLFWYGGFQFLANAILIAPAF